MDSTGRSPAVLLRYLLLHTVRLRSSFGLLPVLFDILLSLFPCETDHNYGWRRRDHFEGGGRQA